MSVVDAKCPNCGASIQLDNDRVEGFCSYCGCKVKVEEAQKLLIQGIVKIDTSDELANLYQIARRAKEADNSENACKYYDMILVKDPNSWEATFYVTYYQAIQCKIAGIYTAAASLLNCERPVLELVQSTIPKESVEDIVCEIYSRLSTISSMLFSAARNHFVECIKLQMEDQYGQEYIDNAHAAVFVMYTYGDLLIELFNDEYGDIAALAWKDGIQIHRQFIYLLNGKEKDIAMVDQYVEKIKKYDSAYVKPEIKTTRESEGCYVATSIYGSYDCPQVWTLRRFRDDMLSNHLMGRIFIKTYYSISPTLVKWFGEGYIFKAVLTPVLDKFVSSLNKRGVSDKPYKDK